MKGLSFHSLIGGIAFPNDASISLHEKLNFKKVAHFEQVGFKMNRWVDVGYWELLLNS
jgi:L-amino acid N-acyltransferase YncA